MVWSSKISTSSAQVEGQSCGQAEVPIFFERTSWFMVESFSRPAAEIVEIDTSSTIPQSGIRMRRAPSHHNVTPTRRPAAAFLAVSGEGHYCVNAFKKCDRRIDHASRCHASCSIG